MRDIKSYLSQIDEIIAKGKFKDNWESLSQFVMPKWYKQGRFGLFIHWGAYSVPATFNEWYPRLMYNPLSVCCRHRIATYGKDCDYRQIVGMFKPDKFDADAWLDVFKRSGAKYIMPVGEHHDGVKMYGSELNQWNMLTQNGRDYMAELHAACDKNDIGFCISNHRAEHFWFMNNARKYFPDSEVAKNEYSDLYGAAYLPSNNNAEANEDTSLVAETKEWLEDWLASACEMIDKNKPLAVYFDWCVNKSTFKPYMKKFLAYYYNRGIEWGKEVGVFYKWGAVMHGCAIFDVERGQIDGVSRELWQNDTAIAKNSWGYTEGNKFKSVGDIVRNLIEVIAKNGCYMLNVGPKSNGEICDEEKAVLLGIGKWLAVNGEAIYDSEPYEGGYIEGKKSINGSFQENKKYAKDNFCFTSKLGVIYAFPMSGKIGSTLKIKSLKHGNDHGIHYQITKVEILGLDNKVTYVQDKAALTINIDGAIDNTTPICIKISVD